MTDAAEQAGLSHLVWPAKVAGVSIVVLTVMVGTVAVLNGKSVFWHCLAALVPPLLLAIVLYYTSRRFLRASGQIVGLQSSDRRVSLISRTTASLVLTCEATVGLVLLGIHLVVTEALNIDQASSVVMVAAATMGLIAIMVARASTIALHSTSEGCQTAKDFHTVEGCETTEDLVDAPHPGSLALLVANTFHAPLLRLSGLVLLSIVGHMTLLLFSGHSSPSQTTGTALLEFGGLYPHLLKFLALVALLFAALVVRTTESELAHTGWLRACAVYFVLVVAGAWSLSAQLPSIRQTIVPSTLTGLFVLFALATRLGLQSTRALSHQSLFSGAMKNASGAFIFLGLLLLLLLVPTPKVIADDSSGLLEILLLTGAFAAVPLSVAWPLSVDLELSSRRTKELALFNGPAFRGNSSVRVGHAQGPLPWVALVLVLAALSVGFAHHGQSLEPQALMFLSIGFCIGALNLCRMLGHVEKHAEDSIEQSRVFIRTQESGPADLSTLNLSIVVDFVRQAIESRAIPWLLAAVAPAGAALVIVHFLSEADFVAFCFGLAAGATTLGIGLYLVLSEAQETSRRSLAGLALNICLTQALWLFTARSIFS